MKMNIQLFAAMGFIFITLATRAAIPDGLTSADWQPLQLAYLKASNCDSGDYFGHRVAIDGNTAVVGVQGESSSASGVNGDQTDNSVRYSGAAYVFIKEGGSWKQQAYLKASNPEAWDRFGDNVAISGDTIVVGAAREDSVATGVNGNQSDNSCDDAGAAYVFVRQGTNWTQQAYLKASNTGAVDMFGERVAISGDTIVVGAVAEDSDSPGVNGDQSINIENYQAGAAYVFVRSGTNWTQQAYLKSSWPDKLDTFGRWVSIDGDTIVVGADGEASSSTGVNGSQLNNNAPYSGAAYVFVRSGTTWSQQAYLKASNVDVDEHSFNKFGYSTSISGDTIVVGAFHEDSAATGVNGDQADNSYDSAGAAYVFVRSGTTWNQQAYLKASNTDAYDSFAHAVAISGDTIVIGAHDEASSVRGFNGDQSDNSAPDSGAVYIFQREGTTWSQKAYLKSSNAEADDIFGFAAVAASGDTIIVGAMGEASGSSIVNGDQQDNSATGAGAAYVFTSAYRSSITNSAMVAEGFKVDWLAADGWESSVSWTPDILEPFTSLTNLAYPQNSFIDTQHDSESSGFYRVYLKQP